MGRGAAFHPLRVARVEPLCEDAVAITFAVADELAEAFAFRPGQHLTLRRTIEGREERRSYSLCSPQGAAPRIGVRMVPGGLFSPWLVRDVRPGDTVEVMAPPAGAFTPRLGTPGRHVLVAAGSGVTPMVSIAPSLLAAHPAAEVVLVYGNRRTDTVMFADELADLKDAHLSRLQLVHVLSREPRETELFSGRLDAARLTALLDALIRPESGDHWWLCGPEGMLRAARTALAEHGVPADRVHQELFHVADEPPRPMPRRRDDAEGPGSKVTVVLDGRTTTTVVRRDRSVLEGAQRARPDIPFACKGGVCGSCRARVVEGELHMRRNFALEDAEVAAGYVLTCQSFPTSDALTVDYDS